MPSMTDSKPQLQLYTDGACSGNPGPGGWAFILRHLANGTETEHAGFAAETTNNRMELTAVIEGLSALTDPSQVEVWSDSQYVLHGLRDWLDGWKAKGWRRSGNKRVLNVDLWRQLDALRDRHELQYQWVAGHDGHPENERCDQLAVDQIEQFRE